MSKTPGFFDWRLLKESYSFQFDPNANYVDPDFGLPQGSVDSGKAGYGGDNNNWGGSMQRALAFGKIANEFVGKNIISSQKRKQGFVNKRGESRQEYNQIKQYRTSLHTIITSNKSSTIHCS
jgi:hypothetical protein